MKFNTPKIEVICFSSEDIITTSGGQIWEPNNY